MTRIQGFPPIEDAGARTLILGSMPSRESLARHRYYAHPRNAFWPILSSLLQLPEAGYEQQAEQVARRGIAIWDVLKTCVRSTSLDSDIEEGSVEVNDFPGFYASHPGIERIFFNGAKAESLYLRHVLPALESHQARLPHCRLPSTSPANAAMSMQQKREAWRVILGEERQ
ncbi:MAG: DNA-deoxyinosine glycosylase [Lysobacterales bacterium]|jgi:TDG/mug DNA glycosylase family protein